MSLHALPSSGRTSTPLKIGIIAPVSEPIGDIGYGGTERVVECVVRGLHALGHAVYLFAAGNSSEEIRGHCILHAIEPTSLRQIPPYDNDVIARMDRAPFAAMKAIGLAKRFGLDFVFNHMGYPALAPFAMTENPVPMATVLHGYLGEPAEAAAYRHPDLRGHPVISISNDQRRHLPRLNYIRTIHNPIPDMFTFRPLRDEHIILPQKVGLRAGSYLAWVGRFSPEKRPHIAIDVAVKSGIPLVLAGKREAFEEAYWEKEIAPRLAQHSSLVKCIGEVNDAEKDELMGGARAFLMPIKWHEPFGLVVPESMNTGTPVVATTIGSMPELIDEGKTGFLVPDFAFVDEASTVRAFVERIRHIDEIDRGLCREIARERFSIAAAARGYVHAAQGQLTRSIEGSKKFAYQKPF